MAQITTEDTAELISNLITRVRRAVGDTESSAINQRWSDAEIIDALNLEIFKITAEQGIGNIASMLTSANLSYTGGAETVALSTTVAVSSIFMIHDVTNTPYNERLEHRSILDYNAGVSNNSRFPGGRGWTRIGNSIAISPIPSNTVTLKIWYLRAPYGTSTSYGGSDQSPIDPKNEELLSVGAAIRLQETDGEIPDGRIQRYQDLWQRFIRSKYSNRGPIHVRRNRKYR